jgi:hypothetical protein
MYTFVASMPTNPDLGALENLKSERERFALKDGVFYLHAPDGKGDLSSLRTLRRHLALQSPVEIGGLFARLWRSKMVGGSPQGFKSRGSAI